MVTVGGGGDLREDGGRQRRGGGGGQRSVVDDVAHRLLKVSEATGGGREGRGGFGEVARNLLLLQRLSWRGRRKEERRECQEGE